MDFKKWLLSELNMDMSQFDSLIRMKYNAADLLECVNNMPFIYVAKTDKLFIGRNGQYHHEMISDMYDSHPEDRDSAYKVREDYEAGAVGRIGWKPDGIVIFNNDAIVAFYEYFKKLSPEYAKRSVELLLDRNRIKPTAIVKINNKIMLVTDYLANHSPEEVKKLQDRDNLRLAGNAQRIAELEAALRSGRWLDGRDLTKPEIEYIKSQLDVFNYKPVKKNPWQAAMEKEKLIAPGTNFRTPYSDATNYEL